MTERTPLSIKLHQIADSGHPRAVELREKADAFDKATEAFSDSKKILGTWARARRLYCDVTGEDLV